MIKTTGQLLSLYARVSARVVGLFSRARGSALALATLALALFAPTAARADQYTYAATVMSSEWVKIQDNVTDITRVTPVSAITVGGALGVYTAYPYYVKVNGNQMTFQIQVETDWLKCMGMAFKVEGDKLYARQTYARYTTKTTAGTVDFDTASVSQGTIGTGGYGIQSITFDYVALVEAVPAEYQRLQYLKSSGTQYVDTGVAVKNTISVEAKILNVKNDASMHMVGARTAFQNQAIGLSFQIESGNQGYAAAYGTEVAYSMLGNDLVGGVSDGWHVFKIGATAKVDDATKHAFTAQTFSSDKNIYAFTVNNGGTPHAQMASISIAWLLIKDGESIERYLLPVRRLSDDELGFYDTVNDVWYPNAGTGVFEAGPAYVDLHTYPAEWIENTYDSYFVTDYCPGPDTRTDAKFIPYNGLGPVSEWTSSGQSVSSRYGTLWGTRPGTTDYRCYQISTYSTIADYASYRGGSGDTLQFDFHMTRGEVTEFRETDTEIVVNGVTVATGVTRSGATDVPIAIFAINNNGSIVQRGKYRLFHLRFWEKGKLVRSYVPYVKNDVVGLFEECTGTFLAPRGTGTVSSGPVAAYDDDALEVEAPASTSVGAPSPAYGRRQPLAQGDAFDCTFPAFETNGFRYVATGWTLYTNSAAGGMHAWKSGTGDTCAYVHPGRFAKLRWDVAIAAAPVASPVAPTNLYERIEYVESTGSQYVKSGYCAKMWTETRVGYQFLGAPVAYGNIVASRASNNSAYLYAAARVSNVTPTSHEHYYGNVNIARSYAAGQTTYHETVFNDPLHRLYEDGFYLGAWAHGSFSEAVPVELFIFARNTGSGVEQQAQARIHHLEFWEFGVPATAFIPVKRLSDGAVGFYDAAQGVFWGASGTGALIAGPHAETADGLRVSGTAGMPAVADLAPAAGDTWHHAPGEAIACTSFAAAAADGFLYACNGYVVYTNDLAGARHPWLAGSELSVAFAHPGSFTTVEWQWEKKAPGMPWSSASYVQDGLLAHWDGIENVAPFTHADATASWVDLVGGRAFALTAATVGDKGLTFAGNVSSFGYLSPADTAAVFDAPLEPTVELVYRYAGGTANGIPLMSSSKSGIALGVHNSGQNVILSNTRNGIAPYFTSGTAVRTVATHYSSRKAVAAWGDGAQFTSFNAENNWSYADTATWIGKRNYDNAPFKGDVMALRVYNRHLSAAEIVHNKLVDDYRFRGVSYADVVDVAGEPGRYGESSPDYGIHAGYASGAEVSASLTSGTVTAGDVTATCTGYVVYTNAPNTDAWTPWLSGSGTSVSFNHPGVAVRLVWQWRTSAAASLSFIGFSATNVASVTVSAHVGGWGDAATASLKAAWGFAPDALDFTTTLQETAVAGTDVRKTLQLPPGATCYVKLFLEDSDGGKTWVTTDPEVVTLPDAYAPLHPDAYSYVGSSTNLFHWDGIDNAGTGIHDSSSTIWKDLSGCGYDLQLTPRGSWRANAMAVDDYSARYLGGKGPLYQTIEAVFRTTSAPNNWGMIFTAERKHSSPHHVMTGNYGRYAWFSTASAAERALYLGDDIAVPHGVAATYNAISDSAAPDGFFLDGARVVEPPVLSTTFNNGDGYMAVGARKPNEGLYSFFGDVYAIRAWGGRLTDVELLANNRIDRIRFFGEEPADGLVVTGDPAVYGAAAPCAGRHYGLSEGASFICSAAASVSLAGGATATCQGWNLYTNVAGTADWALAASGAGATCAYVHGKTAAKLEWRYAVEGPAGVTFLGQTATNRTSAAFVTSVSGFGTGVTAADLAVAWGVTSGEYAVTSVVCSAVAGQVATNRYEGVPPGAAVAKLLLLDKTTGAVLAESAECRIAALDNAGALREPFVEVNGNAWFDTGHKPTVQSRVEIDYRFLQTYKQYRVFGVEAGTLFMTVYQNGSGFWAYAHQNNSGNGIATATYTDVKRHFLVYDMKNSVFSIDYGSTAYASPMTGTASQNANNTLYVCKGNGDSNPAAQMRVYDFRIYENDALVQHLVPREVDGEGVLWDVVANAAHKSITTVPASFGAENPGADALEVVGSPVDGGAVLPAYGAHLGIEIGDAFTCVAPKDAAGDVKYVCTGWEIWRHVADTFDDWTLEASGDGNVCTYVHGATAGRLVWKWSVKGPAGVSAAAATAVARTSATIPVSIAGFGYAADSADLYAAWGYSADVLAFTNRMMSSVTPATTPDVTLDGLAPGATVHVRFFLKDNLGNVTEAPAATSFTTSDFWWREEFAPMAKATGSQCFDTGIYPNRGTRVTFTQATTDKSADKMTFGERNYGFNFLVWFGKTAGTTVSPVIAGATTSVADYSSGKAPGERWTLDFGLLSGLWVDDVEFLSGFWFKANYDSAATSTGTLYLMGLHDKNNAGEARRYVGEFYRSKVYQDGALVRDYRPRLKDDGVTCGIYDAVANAWVATTGTFEWGGLKPLEDDSLVVAGFPGESSTPGPSYGRHSDLAEGDAFTCSAPAFVDGTRIGRVAGWKLYEAVPDETAWQLVAEGDGDAVDYAHGTESMKLEWQWRYWDEPGLTFNGVCETNGTSVRIDATVKGFGYDAETASLEIAWGYDAGTYLYTNVLAAVVYPGFVTNFLFDGLSPATEYHARLFLRDSVGGIVEMSNAAEIVFETENTGLSEEPRYVAALVGVNTLEYVTFNGSTYVTTGIIPSGHEIQFTYRTVYSTAFVNDAHVIGTDYSGSSYNYVHWTEWGSGATRVDQQHYCWGYDGSELNNYGTVVTNVIHVVDYNKKNGSTYETWLDGTRTTFSKLSKSYSVLNIGRRSSVTNWKGDMFEFAMIDHATGQDVLHYYPAKDPDGKVCFFDAVARKYVYPSAGTLVAGPESNPSAEFLSMVRVSGKPVEKRGTTTPGYGIFTGYAQGDKIENATAFYHVKDGVTGFPVGYTVYTNDVSGARVPWFAEDVSGDWAARLASHANLVFSTNHPGCATWIDWNWVYLGEKGLAFNDVVETNTANAMLDVNVTGWGYDAPRAQLKMAYGFRPDNLQYTNVLWDVAVPGTATNIFATGFIPGQHYYLRLFLEDSAGGIVDCGVTRELETSMDWEEVATEGATGDPGVNFGGFGVGFSGRSDDNYRFDDKYYPPNTNVELSVSKNIAAGTSVYAPGNQSVLVYWGSIYLKGGTYNFAAQYMDYLWLKIDDQVLMRSTDWANVQRASITRDPGWYKFEARFSHGSGNWGGSFGLRYNIGGSSTSSNKSDYPNDVADTGDGTFLRTGSGGFLEDCFLVAGAPSNYMSFAASPLPCYGRYATLAEGDGFVATSPHQFDDGRAFLTTIGWQIDRWSNAANAFALESEGDGTNTWYRHGTTAGKLTWIFLVSNHLEVAANVARRGDVAYKRAGETDWHVFPSDFNVLFATNEVVTIRAFPGKGTAGSQGYSFKKWSGELPSGVDRESAEIQIRMDVPRRITATFDAPYSIGATSKATFKIAGYTGSGALENFPVPVRLSEATMDGFDYSRAADGGEDLRFYDQWGEPLLFDVENWDAKGESVAWVSVPNMDNGVEITMMYGDGQSADDNDPTEVWSRADYKAVYHMNQEGKQQEDATGNDAMTATTTADVLLGAGMVGSAIYKTGTLTAPNIHANAGVNSKSYTVSGWYYWPDNSAGTQWTDPFSNGGWGSWSWYFEYNYSNYSLRFIRNANVTGYFNTLDSSKYWNHLCISYNGSRFDIYVNGVRNTTASQAWTSEPSATPLSISTFKGWVDETRVRNAVSSADWILAEYMFATNGARAVCTDVSAVGGGGETIYVGVNPTGLDIGGEGFTPDIGGCLDKPVSGTSYGFAAPTYWTSADGQLMGVRRGYVVRREDGWCQTNRTGSSTANRSFSEMEELQWQYDVFHGLVETNGDNVAFGFTASGFVPPEITATTGTVFALWGYTESALVNSNRLATVTTGAYHRCVLNGLEPEHAYVARVYFRLPDGSLQEDPHGLYRFCTTSPAFGGQPGLFQYRVNTSGNGIGTAVDWSQHKDDRVLAAFPVFKTYSWKSADGMKSYSWSGGGTWAWSGYMWFDKKTYTFGGAYDDYYYLKVNGTVMLNGGGSGLGTKQWDVPTAGWYPIELRVCDTGGGYGPWNWNWGVAWNMTGYKTQDSSNNWKPFQDTGDGTLLRTEPGLGGIEIVQENVEDGKLMSVDLQFGAIKTAGTLYALYSDVAGTEKTNTWRYVEKVGSLAKGATTFTASVTNLWGAADRRVLCFYYQTASELIGSENLYFRDYRAPYLTELEVGGRGGDTLNVTGRLKSYQGPTCELKIWVGETRENLNVCWAGFPGSRRTKARSFNFDLFEADVASDHYFRPGNTYFVCVEAIDTFGRTYRSKVLEVTMSAESAFASATLTEMNRRTAKWSVKMAELGASDLDTVSLWIGTEAATNEFGEADEAQFTQPMAAQSIFDNTSHEFAYTFPELEKDYFWQFRSANATQGGTTNWVIRTAPQVVSTKDTTTYTWRRSVREGRWDDPANWSANTSDAIGWPSSKSCSVNFDHGTEAIIHCPTNIYVDYIYFNSKHMKLTFDTKGRVPGDEPIEFYAPRIRFFDNKSDNTDYADEISFSDLKVWWSYDWDYHPVGWRLTFTDGAIFNYPHDGFRCYPTTKNAPYGWNQFEVLNGATANFNNYYFGGGARVLVSNATMVCRSQFLVSCWQGGGVVRFEGTNPVLKVGSNFRGDVDMSGNVALTNKWGGCEFNVPAGGYAEPPIQFTGTGNYLFGGSDADGKIAKPVQLWIDPLSPAAWTDETITSPLVTWSKGVNTNQVQLMTLPNAETDALLYSSPLQTAWTETNAWDAAYGVATGLAVRIVGDSRSGSVTVTAWPAEKAEGDGAFMPTSDANGRAYETFDDVLDGYVFKCPAAYEKTDERGTCAGWKWYAEDPFTHVRTLVSEGSGNNATYVQTNAWMILEWQWAVEYRVTVNIVGSGQVAGDAEQWVAHGASPDLVATESDTTAFYRWNARSGTLDLAQPDRMTTNLTCVVTGPLQLEAQFGKCIFVATNGNDSLNGLTLGNAKKTVLNAYNAAADGDSILVDAGDHNFYKSNNDNDILLMTKAVTIRSLSGDPASARLYNSARNRRVLIMRNASGRLKDITIRYGSTSANSQRGSCVCIDTQGGIVDNCIIRDGITGNWGASAGGISCYSGNGYIFNSVITNCTMNNYDQPYGTAVYMEKGLMRNCRITGCYTYNPSYGTYGTVYLTGSARMESTQLDHNQARDFAGVYVEGNSTATVDGCTFWENVVAGDTVNEYRDVFDGPESRFTNCKARKAFDENWTAIGGIVDESLPLSLMPTPSKIVQGQSIWFTPHYAPAEVKPIEAYQYVFGDGSTQSYPGPSDGVSLSGTTHTYTVPKIYSPKLNIRYTDQSVRTFELEKGITVFPTNMYVRNASFRLGSAVPEFPYNDPQYNSHTNIFELVDMAIDGCTIVVDGPKNGVAQIPLLDKTLHVQRAITIRGMDPADPGRTQIYRSKTSDNRLIRLDHPQARLEHLCISNAYCTQWGENNDGRGYTFTMQGYGGVVSNCVVKNNRTSQSRLACFANGAKSIITHTTFTNNIAEGAQIDGAVALMISGGAQADNCLFTGNIMASGTGTQTIPTVWVDNGWLVNCTIVNNTTRRLGGVYANGTYGRVVNCVILGNLAVARTEDYNDVDASQSAAYFNCVTSVDFPYNETCTKENPWNVFNDWDNGDLTPFPAGALHEKGTKTINQGTVVPYGKTDFAGNPRLVGKVPDIGCWECQNTNSFQIGFAVSDNVVAEGGELSFTPYVMGGKMTDTFEYWWDPTTYGFNDQLNNIIYTTEPTNVVWRYSGIGDKSPQLKVTKNRGKVDEETVTVKRQNLVYVTPECVYVDQNSRYPIYPYASWATAATNLEEAISIARTGAKVTLAEGTYDIKAPIEIKYGITVRGPTNDPAKAMIRMPGVTSKDYMLKMSNAKLVVSGLTLDAGAKNGKYNGCVLVDYGGGTISNCVLQNAWPNERWQSGFTWRNLSGYGLLTHSKVTNCAVLQNGATDGNMRSILSNESQSGRISNCLICDNNVRDNSNDNRPIIRNWGTMDNCTIVNNNIYRTGNYGQHIRNESALAQCINCVFAHNTVGTTEANRALTLAYSMGASTNLCNALDCNAVFGKQLIEIDEDRYRDYFQDANGGDFHSSARSKIKNGGTAEAVPLPAGDYDGRKRWVGQNPDVGCYESITPDGLLLIFK